MTNWIPGAMSYPQWMQAEKFRKEISLDFSRTADRLIANSNQLDEISEKRLAKIAKLNRQDFESVTNALESFHADFNYKIGLVIQELEFQSEVLNSILYTLKNPLGTQVKELYNYGCQLIKEGLLSEAISKFKSALAIDNSSFLCHYQLGLLYLYGRNWSGSVINLDLANSHLLIACRLGKGKAQVNVSFYPIVANCYFAASLSFYFQLNNLNQVDNFKSSNDNYLLDQAIKCATSAIAYNNKLSQAHYHLAKFCFLKHQFDSSQQHLHNAIAHDKNYAVDAPNDKIFIRNNVEFHKILSRIKINFHQFSTKKIDEVKNELIDLSDGGIGKKIKNDFKRSVMTEYDSGTIIGYLNAFENSLNLEWYLKEFKRLREKGINEKWSATFYLSIGGAIVGFWAGIIFGIGGCDKGIEFVISRLFNCIIIGFASGLVYGIIIWMPIEYQRFVDRYNSKKIS